MEPTSAPRGISRARVIAVGGLDPNGHAGIVRDFLSAEAVGVPATMVATAFTRQASFGVDGIEPRDPASVRRDLRWALGAAASEACAVKVGMVATPDIVGAIVEALGGFTGPVVFDPVLRASSGGALFLGSPSDLLPLIRKASVLTPNAPEAAALTGRPVTTIAEARAAARLLRRQGAASVLVKGGHLIGDGDTESIDVLAEDASERELRAPRVSGASLRGTGCALATVLAAELAQGLPLDEAVTRAKEWLYRQLQKNADEGR